MIVHLVVELIKKALYKMCKYFPKPCKRFGGDIDVIVDLYNHATKSLSAVKLNLANLKAEIDKIDFDKWKTLSVDLSKLGNVANNDVVKKLCMINNLQTK